MKKIKLLCLLPLSFFIIGCGTAESKNEINPKRGFDMWEYMTAPLNYEVEYAFYENGERTDYYIEINQVSNEGNSYERRSETGVTTLYLNSNYIVMKEPTREVEISRYLNLEDINVFRGSDIDNCNVERFYSEYTVHNLPFNNVLMINCLSKSGVKQELYYGYSEGIVAIYQDNNGSITEYVKVKEKQIF